MSSLVVSDTSPVRALNHLGLLHLLQDLFTTVEAKRHALVPAVHPLLIRLRQELAFFLSDALLHRVLALAGEGGP